jgi:excisionase family DNA binding protein
LRFLCLSSNLVGMGSHKVQHAGGELVTTGRAAELLGTSRQHVVDLCTSGRLRFQLAGTHRRVWRSDVEALRRGAAVLTRDQQRSLWLHRAVAGKLVLDPGRVRVRARGNLARMRAVHPRGRVRGDFDTWEVLLDGSLDRLFDVLVSTSPQAVELRQNSPFAGVLTERERVRALDAFRDAAQAA